MSGGLGGLGGFDIGNLLGALGQSLLTSPRYAPLQGFPGAIDTMNKRQQDVASRAAMTAVAQKLGIDPAIAANPAALALLIQQQNQQQNMDLTKQTLGAVDSIFGGSAAPGGATRAQVGGLGGLGGVPSMAGGAAIPKTMPPSPEVAAAIQKYAPAAGIDPVDLATAMSYETGGTFTTNRTPNGRIGLIQFGPTEARQYGAAPGQSSDEQVQASIRYLQDRGLKPGMGMMDLYSTINAGAPGLYNRSDTANGGAPGTVADKVNNQMAGHRQRAQALLGSVEPTTSEGRMAALTSGQGSQQPFQVAAAGAKIPVPLQNVPNVPPPHPNTAGDGTATQRVLAQAQAKYGMKLMIVGGATKNEGVIKVGQSALDLAKEYLKPTEIEKVMDAAGVTGERRRQMIEASGDKRPEVVRQAEAAYPGQPTRVQEAARNALPDNRPMPVRLGEAAQDTPGLVKSGAEAEAAQRGAATAATSAATARTAQAAAATTAAKSAQVILPALDEAQKHFEAAAKLGGVGPTVASPVGRYLDARVPTGNREAEIARQNFDKAIASVKMAKSAINLKGQGAVSNFERTLAAADLPTLDVADPSVAINAFDRIREQLGQALKRDREEGLNSPTPGTPTPLPAGVISTPYGTLRQVR